MIRVPFRLWIEKVLVDRATCWWIAQYVGSRPPRGKRIAFAMDTGAWHRGDPALTNLQRAREDREDREDITAPRSALSV